MQIGQLVDFDWLDGCLHVFSRYLPLDLVLCSLLSRLNEWLTALFFNLDLVTLFSNFQNNFQFYLLFWKALPKVNYRPLIYFRDAKVACGATWFFIYPICYTLYVQNFYLSTRTHFWPKTFCSAEFGYSSWNTMTMKQLLALLFRRSSFSNSYNSSFNSFHTQNSWSFT